MGGMPRLIRPMLASLRRDLPRDADRYGWEFKWDGVRAVGYLAGGALRLLSRTGRDITASYPELAVLAGRVPTAVTSRPSAWPTTWKASSASRWPRPTIRGSAGTGSRSRTSGTRRSSSAAGSPDADAARTPSAPCCSASTTAGACGTPGTSEPGSPRPCSPTRAAARRRGDVHRVDKRRQHAPPELARPSPGLSPGEDLAVLLLGCAERTA